MRSTCKSPGHIVRPKGNTGQLREPLFGQMVDYNCRLCQIDVLCRSFTAPLTQLPFQSDIPSSFSVRIMSILALPCRRALSGTSLEGRWEPHVLVGVDRSPHDHIERRWFPLGSQPQRICELLICDAVRRL